MNPAPTPPSPRTSPTDTFTKMTVEELYRRLQPIARNLMLGQRRDMTWATDGSDLLAALFLKMEDFVPRLEKSATARRKVAKCAQKAMFHLLIDHAKEKGRIKRGGGREQLPLHLVGAIGGSTREAIDIIALGDALDRLEVIDPSAAEYVQLRFCGGLTTAEIAAVWQTRVSEVDAQWRRTRKWLARELADSTTQAKKRP